MSGTARRDSPDCSPSRLRAIVREFPLSKKGQAGEVSLLMLIIILLAPLVVLGALAFVLIIAYVNRVSRVTAELEAKTEADGVPGMRAQAGRDSQVLCRVRGLYLATRIGAAGTAGYQSRRTDVVLPISQRFRVQSSIR